MHDGRAYALSQSISDHTLSWMALKCKIFPLTIEARCFVGYGRLSRLPLLWTMVSSELSPALQVELQKLETAIHFVRM